MQGQFKHVWQSTSLGNQICFQLTNERLTVSSTDSVTNRDNARNGFRTWFIARSCIYKQWKVAMATFVLNVDVRFPYGTSKADRILSDILKCTLDRMISIDYLSVEIERHPAVAL